MNSVRWIRFVPVEFRTVWLHPLAAPTSIVACGPRRISDAMSTTYDTDMLEPPAIGSLTLKAEVSDERRIRKTSGAMGVKVARGSNRTSAAAPRTITATMYPRARGGRSRSTTAQYTATKGSRDSRGSIPKIARSRLSRGGSTVATYRRRPQALGGRLMRPTTQVHRASRHRRTADQSCQECSQGPGAAARPAHDDELRGWPHAA